MTLTEEQRKRMEENRKRAIEIKRKKQLESETSAASVNNTASSVFDAGGFVVPSSSEEMEAAQNKKRRINGNDGVPEVANAEGKSRAGDTNFSTKNNSPESRNNTNEDARNEDDDDESSLEDFERDASPYISQTEAQRTYCIPKGTLEVCSYIEKDNPIKRGFSKMKLYDRSEVRRRARKRFGGKEGLIRERERRKKKRFEKDLAETKDVFR